MADPPGAADALAQACMAEIGLAHSSGALEAVEYWPPPDPSQTEDSREQRLAAYPLGAGGLPARLKQRFPTSS